MPPELRTWRSVPGDALLARVGDAYLDAFSRPPYLEQEAARQELFERLRRYEPRDGFRLVLAEEDGDVVGLALAVVGHPGDWFRDRVAEQLEPAEIAAWLGDACLELVHLAVRPAREGRGIGGALHDAALAGAPADTAILTVHPEAERARRLYEQRGWQVLRDSVSIGASDGVALLAKPLPLAGTKS